MYLAVTWTPALWAEWPDLWDGYWNKSAQKADPEEKNSPAPLLPALKLMCPISPPHNAITNYIENITHQLTKDLTHNMAAEQLNRTQVTH